MRTQNRKALLSHVVASQTKEKAGREIQMMFSQLNPHHCLSYLIGGGDSHQIAIVDPVLEHVKDYLELLDRNNYKLGYVIDTHSCGSYLRSFITERSHRMPLRYA